MFLRLKDYRYQQHQISVDTTKNYLLLVNVSDLLPFSRLEYPFSLWKVSRECPQCAARTRSWEHPGTHSSWPPPQPSLSSVCLHNCRTSGFSKQQAQMVPCGGDCSQYASPSCSIQISSAGHRPCRLRPSASPPCSTCVRITPLLSGVTQWLSHSYQLPATL